VPRRSSAREIDFKQHLLPEHPRNSVPLSLQFDEEDGGDNQYYYSDNNEYPSSDQSSVGDLSSTSGDNQELQPLALPRATQLSSARTEFSPPRPRKQAVRLKWSAEEEELLLEIGNNGPWYIGMCHIWNDEVDKRIQQCHLDQVESVFKAGRTDEAVKKHYGDMMKRIRSANTN
jgi:hypothetical protein